MAKKTIVRNPIPQSMEEKQKAAKAIVDQINASMQDPAIIKMDEKANLNVPVISTGSLAIDLASGIGGLPAGRIIEVYGPESSGKTSLTLSTIAQCQKKAGIAAFIDAEHSFDPSWARKFGVKIEDLYVAQPSSGEEALEIVDSLVRSNAFDIIVIDSVAALVPKAEIEGNMGDSMMGVQARLMSQALRKITGAVSKSSTVVVFINQIRLKIGVMFGNPETTTGGNALKFYSSQRYEIRKVSTDDKTMRLRVKVVKNKLAAPFKIIETDLVFDQPGVFSLAGEIVDIGSNYGVVEKNGNTYTLRVNSIPEGVKMGVGRQNAVDFLNARPELKDEAKDQITNLFKEALSSGRLRPEADSSEDEEMDDDEDQESGFDKE